MPPSHKELLAFIELLREADSGIEISIYQNTEFYKVDLAPPYVGEVFQKRIGQ